MVSVGKKFKKIYKTVEWFLALTAYKIPLDSREYFWIAASKSYYYLEEENNQKKII